MKLALAQQNRQSINSRFDISDAVQEAMVQLWKSHQEDPNIDTAWINRIATGHFCKLQRMNLAMKRTVLMEEECDVDKISRENDVTRRLDELEQLEILFDCLEKLDSDSRHAVVRRIYDEAHMNQIATELNVSHYGAKAIFEDGLLLLQTMMNKAQQVKP